MTYENIAIPFVTIGNKRCLTSLQLLLFPHLDDFVKQFPDCFELHPYLDVLVFCPPGEK